VKKIAAPKNFSWQALKRFQTFNHLPATGVLDEATLAQMKLPRCGFPDLGEFNNTGRKWPDTKLTYGFQEFSLDIPAAQVIEATVKPVSPPITASI